MSTYKISIPGHFVQDWSTTSEGWAENIQKGTESREVAAAYTEVFTAITDNQPRKHGRGTRYVVELSEPAVRFLESEAKHRYEFNAPAKKNTFGVEDPDPIARYAASRLMAQCKKALR